MLRNALSTIIVGDASYANQGLVPNRFMESLLTFNFPLVDDTYTKSSSPISRISDMPEFCMSSYTDIQFVSNIIASSRHNYANAASIKHLNRQLYDLAHDFIKYIAYDKQQLQKSILDKL